MEQNEKATGIPLNCEPVSNLTYYPGMNYEREGMAEENNSDFDCDSYFDCESVTVCPTVVGETCYDTCMCTYPVTCLQTCVNTCAQTCHGNYTCEGYESCVCGDESKQTCHGDYTCPKTECNNTCDVYECKFTEDYGGVSCEDHCFSDSFFGCFEGFDCTGGGGCSENLDCIKK